MNRQTLLFSLPLLAVMACSEVVDESTSNTTNETTASVTTAAAVDNALIGEWVTIPAGSFMMGSDDGGDNEQPVRLVSVPAFKLMVHEVTFAQWDACVEAGGCSDIPSYGGRGQRPVLLVSWDDVQTYIGWLNQQTGQQFRLPSEAEWEYAARGGSSTQYSWGDAIGDNNANCLNDYCKDEFILTAPVKSFAPNAFGLYDMHGNVWELLQDCWHGNYDGAPNDGTAWLASDDGNCARRVNRGGSHNSGPGGLRSAVRFGQCAGCLSGSTGFRLAQDL